MSEWSEALLDENEDEGFDWLLIFKFGCLRFDERENLRNKCDKIEVWCSENYSNLFFMFHVDKFMNLTSIEFKEFIFYWTSFSTGIRVVFFKLKTQTSQ
jgi:hypothetical protein